MAPLYLLAFCRSVIALVFVASLVGKLRAFGAFRETLHLSFVPKNLIPTASLAVLLDEALIVLCMITGGILTQFGFLLAMFTLLVFTAYLLLNLRNQDEFFCNCFGDNDEASSIYDVLRNAAFLACAGIGAVTSSSLAFVQPEPAIIFWLPVGVFAVVFVVAWIQFGKIVRLFR